MNFKILLFLPILFFIKINSDDCPDALYVCTYKVDFKDKKTPVYQAFNINNEPLYIRHAEDLRVPEAVSEAKVNIPVTCMAQRTTFFTHCIVNPYSLRNALHKCENELHGTLSVVRECGI